MDSELEVGGMKIPWLVVIGGGAAALLLASLVGKKPAEDSATVNDQALLLAELDRYMRDLWYYLLPPPVETTEPPPGEVPVEPPSQPPIITPFPTPGDYPWPPMPPYNQPPVQPPPPPGPPTVIVPGMGTFGSAAKELPKPSALTVARGGPQFSDPRRLPPPGAMITTVSGNLGVWESI